MKYWLKVVVIIGDKPERNRSNSNEFNSGAQIARLRLTNSRILPVLQGPGRIKGFFAKFPMKDSSAIMTRWSHRALCCTIYNIIGV
ncbi:hypothetical protein PILCRDRAFT_474944 [Piloderma croceum F 1598]|uniref:Uncharacterized protein n=1 Tax=Piloderma croceum (strain F 1598) TaxID=765440 RepID=A0A0C3FCG0_PILCF|nr:hypothetical protein PILCRDRAFT_474944 [Piloderma croceum F 1598]